jgi:hypothetical protein
MPSNIESVCVTLPPWWVTFDAGFFTMLDVVVITGIGVGIPFGPAGGGGAGMIPVDGVVLTYFNVCFSVPMNFLDPVSDMAAVSSS